ncbi:hypothetical protein COCOBI_07-3050 [Coccomyxa sp. Obi]|nr:hypothetical protein COCOBI_07-3050 [Coccomyxa sp. Obi]
MDRTPQLRDRDTQLAQARLGLQAAFRTLQGGKPIAALQELLRITREVGGSDAQAQVIQRAIEAFSHGHTENTQDIAALLAQCNLDVTGQSQQHAEQEDVDVMQTDLQHPAATGKDEARPILAESGREGITDAAMSDGSSFLCQHCGGVVSRSRESQHHLWCSQ